MQTWYQNAIVYHIYPIGFCGAPRRNEGGAVIHRLDKVLDLLPHFKKLNVDTVYFGPVFESVSHGYDTTNYNQVDRRLGDNDSFRRICDTLHRNGIRVILDGVFNHVGRNFAQFKDIQEHGAASPYCSWFANLNFGGQSPFGDPFWYEGWNGCYDLVKLNLRNPAVCDHLIEAVGNWMDQFDIDGLRLDAADCIDFDFFRRLRAFCKERRPDFFLLGEIIHGDYNRWANPDMLDSVTNYECYKGIYSSHNEKNYFEIDYSINRQFGQGGIYKSLPLYNFVDNHDVTRIGSILRNPAHLQNVYTLLYTMPGIPSIYYGSEYGVAGRKEEGDDALRPCLDYDHIPGANTALYDHIVRLGRIYRAYPALRTGEYRTIIIRNQQVVLQKEQGGQLVYVALNLSDQPFEADFGTPLPTLVDVLSGNAVGVHDGNAHLDIPPFCGMILVPDDIVNEAPQQDEPQSETSAALPVPGQHYRHFKGNEYEILALARHSETLEEMVVYKACYGEGDVWVRPLKLFLEKAANGEERFALIS